MNTARSQFSKKGSPFFHVRTGTMDAEQGGNGGADSAKDLLESGPKDSKRKDRPGELSANPPKLQRRDVTVVYLAYRGTPQRPMWWSLPLCPSEQAKDRLKSVRDLVADAREDCQRAMTEGAELARPGGGQ